MRGKPWGMGRKSPQVLLQLIDCICPAPVRTIENSGAKALICATGRNAALAGGAYPFPLIEDGDFNVPSVYMTEEEGKRLREFTGKEVILVSRSERIPGNGYNVTGRKGKPWRQGDHSIFIHYGRPALAVSSDWFIENIDNQDITHTPKDNIGIVDCNKLVELAAAISEIIRKS